MLVDNIHFNAIEKPSGFMVSWTKPRNHETWRLLDIPEMNWMKPRNHETLWLLDVPEMEWTKPRNHETMKPDGFSMSQRWIGWNHETTKPRNHETWRLINVPEMDWMKPWNHETWHLLNVSEMDWMKPWNHETTKPWNLTSFQCPRDGLDMEWTKPRNLSTSRHPETERTKPRNHETMKPWNHETCRLLVIQRWSGRNHETMKPRNLSSFQCPRDGVVETMKPCWQVSRFHGVHGEISHETRNHETSGFVFKKGPWSAFLGTPTAFWTLDACKETLAKMCVCNVHGVETGEEFMETLTNTPQEKFEQIMCR